MNDQRRCHDAAEFAHSAHIQFTGLRLLPLSCTASMRMVPLPWNWRPTVRWTSHAQTIIGP